MHLSKASTDRFGLCLRLWLHEWLLDGLVACNLLLFVLSRALGPSLVSFWFYTVMISLLDDISCHAGLLASRRVFGCIPFEQRLRFTGRVERASGVYERHPRY